MTAFESVIRKLAKALAVVGGISIVSMMGLVVVDVAMKYLLNDPIDGTTAVVAAYFMVALVFLPLAYVSLTSGHLFVELFTQKISTPRLRQLDVFAELVTLAYLLFLVFFTTVEAVRRTAEGEAWETAADLMAVWPSRWLLPIGLAAMAAVVLTRIVRRLGKNSPAATDGS